ncbi:MAG: hypothetical protein WC480_03060 [Patescibacteria group bacterium]
MKRVYQNFQDILSEVMWFFVVQGIFLLAFAVLVLFYPFALIILVALLLICLAVVSLYFGYKILKVKMTVNKIKKELTGE